MSHARTQTVYALDELDEDAKDRAREWYRDGAMDYEWWDATFENAKRLGAMFGVDIDNIYFSGFSSQGDGACFEGSYTYRKGGLAAVKKEAPQDTELHGIAAELQSIQRKNFYRLSATVRQRGHYNHSGCTLIQVDDSSLGSYFDVPDAEDVQQALREFMDWIYRQLEREYEYQMSDELVDESIRANEYEFTESGHRA